MKKKSQGKIKGAFKLFKYIDIFGSSVQLTLKKQEYHKTYFGALITFLIVLATLAGLVYYGDELVNRRTPETSFKTIPVF